MNKNIIVATVTALIIGAGAYTVFNKKDDNSSTPVSSQSVQNTSETTNASINDLITKNTSSKCTYNVEEDGSRNVGTVYFSGVKDMYGEFTSTKGETSETVFVIRQGDTQYFWQQGAVEGYKADVSSFDQQQQAQTSQRVDSDRKYEFKCQDWKKDESKFELPKSVNFQDISTLLNQSQQVAPGTREAVCNAITDPTSKSACLNAL